MYWPNRIAADEVDIVLMEWKLMGLSVLGARFSKEREWKHVLDCDGVVVVDLSQRASPLVYYREIGDYFVHVDISEETGEWVEVAENHP